MNFRDQHNQAMDAMIHAIRAHQLGQETDSKACYLQALEMENEAVKLALEHFHQTQEEQDNLTVSIYSRTAAWFAIKAGEFDEAERIALQELARGEHPWERNNLREVLCVALEKQGFGIDERTGNEALNNQDFSQEEAHNKELVSF